MKRLLLFGGGTWHEFGANAMAIMEAFDGLATCEYTEDPARLESGSLGSFDALATYTCMAAEDDGLEDKSRARLSPAQREGVERFVREGGAFLPLHATMCSYQDWEGLTRLIGVRWIWGESYHGPHETYRLKLNPKHPLASRFEEFEIHDELYRKLRLVHPVDRLMDADAEGSLSPHAWTLQAGKGRVFYWGPGHTAATLSSPPVRRALATGLAWAMGVSSPS